MNETMCKILDKSREIAVLKNKSKNLIRNAGVLFGRYEKDGQVYDEAWVISQYSIIRWSECGPLDFPEDRPFYDFMENTFAPNTTSFPDINVLRDKYTGYVKEYNQSFVIPVNQLVKRIKQEFPIIEKIERSRIIIKNNDGFVFEEELVLLYKDGNFVFPAIPGARFFSDPKKSNILTYKEGQMYRAEMLAEPEPDTIIVNIKDEYFKGIEIGIHEVKEGVFFPDSEKEVIDFSAYPESRVVRYSYPETPPEGGYSFAPIHLETPAFFMGLRMMEGYNFARLFVSSDSRLKPVLITGIHEDSNKFMPKIEEIVGPLNPKIRGYYL